MLLQFRIPRLIIYRERNSLNKSDMKTTLLIFRDFKTYVGKRFEHDCIECSLQV